MINQTKNIIAKREKVKKYLKICQITGGSNSTYNKLMGNAYNGVKNGDLTELDLSRINSGLDKATQSINELKKAINEKIQKKV